MGLFFGTDGLRGKVGEGLTSEISYRVANSISRLSEKPAKILVGCDTRNSGDMLSLAFCLGVVESGASVTNIGVCPTAGISYLTKKFGFDYGVVISASHNPAEFNGIKIFDNNGKKISEKVEKEIEKNLLIIKRKEDGIFGRCNFDLSLVKEYENFLLDTAKSELETTDFLTMKIVLDCSNGVASFVAPKVFETLNAEVVCVGNCPNGFNINKDCGSLNIDFLRNKVLQEKADVGFAYDGDSDRLIAVAEDGSIVDGDQIVYIFANYYLKKGRLKNKTVVGTRHTNMGVEKALFDSGINMIRTDVGDKFVSEMLEQNDLLIGGEQSGHVFVCDKLHTGDGILNSLMLLAILRNENKRLSELVCKEIYHQKNVNVRVENKEKIMNDANLNESIFEAEQQIGESGRVMVRASGTEPIVRIMTESEDEKMADFVAENIEKMIRKIDSRGGLCVE